MSHKTLPYDNMFEFTITCKECGYVTDTDRTQKVQSITRNHRSSHRRSWYLQSLLHNEHERQIRALEHEIIRLQARINAIRNLED